MSMGWALLQMAVSFQPNHIYADQAICCRMSNFKKGEWCDVVDGLYWKFIEKNINFFKTNPRLSLMVNALSKINSDRKKLIFTKAEEFISKNTY